MLLATNLEQAGAIENVGWVSALPAQRFLMNHKFNCFKSAWMLGW
jgi:hypothetical protein